MPAILKEATLNVLSDNFIPMNIAVDVISNASLAIYVYPGVGLITN